MRVRLPIDFIQGGGSRPEYDNLVKVICDTYEYLKHHDVGAAKIRLRTSGVLPHD
jgi:hypothetical protein